MRRPHTYSTPTIDACAVLGAEIARARRARHWTAAELAERAGISPVTLRKVEHGEPTVALGIAFEVAVLVGVRLFGADPGELGALAAAAQDRLAVMPKRVRHGGDLDDDF